MDVRKSVLYVFAILVVIMVWLDALS